MSRALRLLLFAPAWVRASLLCALLFAAAPLPAFGQITVHTDFPGGSGEVVEMDSEGPLVRIDPTDYPARGWRCWWYVRLEGLTPGEPFTLDVGSAPWATPTRPTVSTDDGRTWRHGEPGQRKGKRIRYTLRFDTTSALVAWGPPFVPRDAERLVARISASSPEAKPFELCRTREGRSVPGLRIATPDSENPPDARPLIWVQARQHAWESGASWVARGVAQWLVSDVPEAKQLRAACQIVLIPVMDIDNVARGAGGKSQVPQDHNRDWSDAPHWPSVEAAQQRLRQAAKADRLLLFVDLHNPGAKETRPYFYVSPDQLLTEAAAARLDAFLKIAQAEIRGPLALQTEPKVSGPKYDPENWRSISKNWVALLKTDAVAVTLETPWNTPHSTTDGYQTVGRQLGRAIAAFVKNTHDAKAVE